MKQQKVQTMKNIVAASAILAIFASAGIASAASSQRNERPSAAPTSVVIADKAQEVSVVADTLYSTKELSRAGLEADDVVNVTVFPSAGVVYPKDLKN